MCAAGAMQEEGLNVSQCNALFALFRAAADGERRTELARCQLCEVKEFDPYDTFKALQGGWPGQKGWLTAGDVYTWFASQPHGAGIASLPSAVAVLAPYANEEGELRYDGFLRMVLPKDPLNAWLKEDALVRGARTPRLPISSSQARSGTLTPEVAFRLCNLLECEQDLCKQLAFHRRSLVDLRFEPEGVLALLDAKQGPVAGVGGFLSPQSLRWVLVERHQALSQVQFAALLQRINPTGACLMSYNELAKALDLPNRNAFNDDARRRRSWSPGRYGAEGMSAFADLSPVGSAYLRDRSPVASLAVLPEPRLRPGESPKDLQATWGTAATTAASGRLGASFALGDSGRFSSASYSNPATPTPPYCARLAPATPEKLADRFGPMEAERTPAYAFERYTALPAPPTTTQGDEGPSTPARARSPPSGSAGARTPSRSPFVGAAPPEPLPRIVAPPPRSPAMLPRDPLPTRRASSLPRNGGPSLAATARVARGEIAPASPAWSYCSASPVLPPTATLRGYARGGRTPSPPRLPAPRPVTSSLYDTGLSPRGSPRLELLDRSRRAMSPVRQSRTKAVLLTMARQGQLDGEVEAAKALLPTTCTPEAAFSALDRQQKGYVADSDLWLLVQDRQDFAGAAPFGALCALTREIQLRRTYDPTALPGRLSLRDMATLILPVGSQAYEAVRACESDNEARSVLYLLRASEPCPRCGIRVQRDGNSQGCPNVTCASCGTCFRCFCVGIDGAPPADDASGLMVPWAARYPFQRFLSVAARVAEDLDADRKALLSQPTGFALADLSDAFYTLTDGASAFTRADLRRALADYTDGPRLSDAESELLWRRYAPAVGAVAVSFPDFARQLRLPSVPSLPA